MTRVMYGVASSSYHATRLLLELAKVDEISSVAIQRDFYVGY